MTGEAAETEYQVNLIASRPQFGGRRWWFACPSPACERRVRHLYLPVGGDYFLCRHCHGLTYTSRQQNRRPNALLRNAAAQAGCNPVEAARLLNKKVRDRAAGRCP
jgi:hypothetical protein